MLLVAPTDFMPLPKLADELRRRLEAGYIQASSHVVYGQEPFDRRVARIEVPECKATCQEELLRPPGLVCVPELGRSRIGQADHSGIWIHIIVGTFALRFLPLTL